MATWYDAFWPALKTVIAAAWPDILPGQMFTDTAIERRDWTNLLDSAQMSGPWCVVKTDVQPEGAWGLGAPRYRVTPTVFYIAPHAQGVLSLIVTHLDALAKALTAGGAGLGTVLTDSLVLSINAENPINRSLLDADQAFQAGSLTFSCIVVQI